VLWGERLQVTVRRGVCQAAAAMNARPGVPPVVRWLMTTDPASR
jgi:hypothetical protein